MSPATTASNASSIWLLPAGGGLPIGQAYSAIAVRSQIAF
jgi:hypothetical protein